MMTNAVKGVIGILVIVAAAFTVDEGCSRWNERQREKARVSIERADSVEIIAKPADRSIDSLILVIDQERVERRLQFEALMSRVGRDRSTRVIEYRAVNDTFALALLHRKDTTIDTLTTALITERAEHDTTRFLLDTTIVSRGRWRYIAEERARAITALQKVAEPWWKVRIKPRVTTGYGAVYADGIKHGPGIQLGIQIFP